MGYFFTFFIDGYILLGNKFFGIYFLLWYFSCVGKNMKMCENIGQNEINSHKIKKSGEKMIFWLKVAAQII